jgi:hypothetical protein
MSFFTNRLRATLIAILLLAPAALLADTNCEEGAGPLNPAPPQGITVQEIIQQFATKEELFREARNNYTYTQDITLQTLDGTTVDGEYRLVQDITYNDKGERIENVTFAPQSTLTRIGLNREDFDDIRRLMAFVLTTSELPKYNLLYVGQQKVDEIQTYVFDIAPKTLEKGQRYFQGRLWVDQRDKMIVKNCGKTVPETTASNSKKKNVQENLTPKFVTYREQVDGEFWFPTYIRADDTLHFRTADVQIREIIKLTNYKRFGVKTKITYKGEAKDNSKTPEKKP